MKFHQVGTETRNISCRKKRTLFGSKNDVENPKAFQENPSFMYCNLFCVVFLVRS